MRRFVLCFLLFAAAATAFAQSREENFSAALQRSLTRARALYPDSNVPETALGQSVLNRIVWLRQNEPAIFEDPDWPMKVTSAQANALGIRPRTAPPSPTVTAARPAAAANPANPRYLAMVTKSFSVVGASFRKNQQIILESLQDYNKRGTTIVDGKPLLLWLDNIQVLRELPPGAESPTLVKVESARYGFPGQNPVSVAPMVQALVAPSASGAQTILVSDALLTPNAAQRLNRSIAPTMVTDQTTGAQVLGIPYKVLTVTYTLNGQRKTKQELEGRTLILD